MGSPLGPAHTCGRMCPSTSAANATVFLGMIGRSGRVAYVSPAVPLSREDIEALSTDPDRPLEAQYRFAGPCLESGCGHWAGTHCALGKRIAEAGAAVEVEEHLAKCAIRPQCRWYAEQGAPACHACPHVITDLRVEARG